MKRLVLPALAAAALAVPVAPASAACEDLPVNAACQSSDGYCELYKKPHPRLGRGLCVRLTP
ncbi:MAG TPA: hypothetical protein VGX28_05855 [Frankiaceae bacterium]|nr:hypothetical protein [Frankiaceae bacterium]